MIETERLRLRPWGPADRAVFVAMNADRRVMRHFPAPLNAVECDEKLEKMASWQARLGFTLWAVERRSDGEVLGTCGLKPLTVPWPEPDDIEIGWMFRTAFHGLGYAREAAEAALAFGLARAPRVIAMTVPANAPSVGLMQRLGMERWPELDFDHPDLAPGHPLQRHIVHLARQGIA